MSAMAPDVALALTLGGLTMLVGIVIFTSGLAEPASSDRVDCGVWLTLAGLALVAIATGAALL